MIIRTIATALVQCSARTQAGWMTLAAVALTCSSLTVRLVMADPWLAIVTGLYAGNRVSVTALMLLEQCIGSIEVTKKRAGICPRLAVCPSCRDQARRRDVT